MANNIWIGAGAAAYETGGNWSLGHKPASNEVAIILGTNMPSPPIGSETVGGVTCDVHLLQLLADWGNLTVNGVFTTPGYEAFPVFQFSWGASGSLVFTGGNPGVLSSNDGATAPIAITAAAELVVCPAFGGNSLDLTGCAIVTGGSCVLMLDPSGSGGSITVDATTTITGPGTVGSFFLQIGGSGTPTVTGFEPLSKVGASGTVRSTRGDSSIITLPLAADLRLGVVAGTTEHPITGELVTDGGGSSSIGSHGRLGRLSRV